MHVVLSECPASSSQKTKQNHSNKTINHDMLVAVPSAVKMGALVYAREVL